MAAKRHLRPVVTVLLMVPLLVACQALSGGGGGEGGGDGGGAGGGDAEAYPSGPVTLVVGFDPGGGADVFSRALADASATTLPEPIVVQNRSGGGGTTANGFVARARNDGQTILFGHAGSTILTPLISGTPDLKWDAFQPVARIHAEEELLFLRPDSQWKTIDEVVEFARANPGRVRVGGSAVGGIDNMVIQQLQQAAGVEFTYVPFDGGGPAIQSFLGGNVDVLVGNVSDSAANIDAGEMLPVAVASEERSAIADVPTLREMGWDVVLFQWRGIFAPEGMPADRVQILADAFEQALDTDAWGSYREQSQALDLFLGPDDFREFLEQEEARLAPIIEELGLAE
jgi:putative tricarboxylic transport membrane protein